MSNEITEPVNAPQESDSTPDALAGSGASLGAAIAAFTAGEGREPITPETVAQERSEAPAEGEQSASPTEPAPGDPAPTQETPDSDYYAKLSELDRQNRILRKKLKDVENKAPDNAEKGHLSVDLKSIAKQDPLKALDELGIGIDNILEAYTGATSSSEPVPDIPKSVQEKLKRIEELEARFNELIEGQTKAERLSEQQRLFKQETDKLSAVVESDTARYEMIHATRDEGSLNLVLQVAAEIYNQEGEVPSYDRALGLVEEHLRDQMREQYKRAQNFGFLKESLTSSENVVQSPTDVKTAQPNTQAVSAQEDTPTPKELTKDDLFNQALAKLAA